MHASVQSECHRFPRYSSCFYPNARVTLPDTRRYHRQEVKWPAVWFWLNVASLRRRDQPGAFERLTCECKKNLHAFLVIIWNYW